MTAAVMEDLDPLVRLERDVDELTRPRERGQWVQPDKYEKTIARPDLADRRRGGFYWPPKEQPDQGLHLSLLEQLEKLRGGFNARRPTTGGRAAPGPRLTGGSDVAELLTEINAGAQQLRREALHALGATDTRRADLRLVALGYYLDQAARDEDDARRASRTRYALNVAAERFAAEMTRNKIRAQSSTGGALRHLVKLAGAVDPQLRTRICRQVHSWVNAARLALSYAAPMMSLPGRYCGYCGQTSLVTRSDASGDVFCSTDSCVDENGERPRWPRATWHLLLAAVNDEPTATEETA